MSVQRRILFLWTAEKQNGAIGHCILRNVLFYRETIRKQNEIHRLSAGFRSVYCFMNSYLFTFVLSIKISISQQYHKSAVLYLPIRGKDL